MAKSPKKAPKPAPAPEGAIKATHDDDPSDPNFTQTTPKNGPLGDEPRLTEADRIHASAR